MPSKGLSMSWRFLKLFVGLNSRPIFLSLLMRFIALCIVHCDLWIVFELALNDHFREPTALSEHMASDVGRWAG